MTEQATASDLGQLSQAEWHRLHRQARVTRQTTAAQWNRARVLVDRVLVRDGLAIADMAKALRDEYGIALQARTAELSRLSAIGRVNGWLR